MRCRALPFALLLIASLLAACGGGNATPAASSPPVDSVPQNELQVDSTYPANGSAKAMANTQLSVTFSEALDPHSVTGESFKLADSSGTPVAGSVSYSGVTAVFKPAVPLASNTLYTATVTTGMQCPDGGKMGQDYVWTFGTSMDAEGIPPTVTDTAFAITEQNGAYGGVVVAFLSEAVDPATVNPRTFLVSGPGGIDVPGTLQLIGLTAVFTPDQPFAPLTIYTATVTTGVEDLAGEPMVRPVSWTFTTPRESILTGVSTTVGSVAPANMATDVLLGAEVTVSFSQTMNPATITANTFRVLDPRGAAIPGTVQYTGTTATFIPAAPLQPNTTYEGVLSAAASSLAGIPMDGDYNWNFTTGTESAGTPPVVQFTTPLSSDSSTDLSSSILAAFDEPMDPLSITTATFTLTTSGGMSVSGMVSYTGLTAVFTPSAELAPGTTYTARLTTGVKDAGGTPMAHDYVWSFTTADGSANTIPQVLFTDPAYGDSNIPAANLKITIAFNEVMDPRTINTSNITVTDPNGNPEPGTLDYLAYAVTFTPTTPLHDQTKYTVNVSMAVLDLNGHPMTQIYSFYFVTSGVF